MFAALGEQRADWLDGNVGEVPSWLEGRMPVQGDKTPWTVKPQMLSNFSTLKELNDLRSGEASPLEMISPAASLVYAGSPPRQARIWVLSSGGASRRQAPQKYFDPAKCSLSPSLPFDAHGIE